MCEKLYSLPFPGEEKPFEFVYVVVQSPCRITLLFLIIAYNSRGPSHILAHFIITRVPETEHRLPYSKEEETQAWRGCFAATGKSGSH